MRNVNRVTLLGRIVGAPQSGSAGNKPVCNFVVETVDEWVDRDRVPQRRTALHACTAFGPVALTVEDSEVGESLYVEGSLRAPRDGASEFASEVVCQVAIRVREPAGVEV